MREKRIGHRAVVKVGYGSPVELRGLYMTGAELVYISNLKQLDNVKPKEQAVIVQGTLGLKKKYDILEKAAEKSISVVGINAKKFISDFEAFVKAKQDKKAARKTPAEVKPQAKETKAAEKKPEAKKTEDKEKSHEKAQVKQPQTKEIPPKTEAKKI